MYDVTQSSGACPSLSKRWTLVCGLAWMFLSSKLSLWRLSRWSELPSTAGRAGSILVQGTKIPTILPSMAKTTTKQTKKHSLWRSELPNKPTGPKDIAEAEKEKERCWRSPRCRVRTRLQAKASLWKYKIFRNFPQKKLAIKVNNISMQYF